MTPIPAPDLRDPAPAEWPTLALLAATYAAWAAVTLTAPPPWVAVPLLAPILALHSSLQHEALHGHPTRHPGVNEALVFPALGLLVPYGRFRDTHLDHHHDPKLTDPYDDPESNYLDPAVWERLPGWRRRLHLFNNTLIGRMLVGPALGMTDFVAADLRAMRAGVPGIARAWALHAVGAVPVLAAVLAGGMPVWAYLLACWLALSILKIRTFLEHRAHERHPARSVIVEDRGPLAFQFLNNNFHAVHHAHPQVPWYRLPALYAARQAGFLERNGGYRYASYAEVFRRHFLRRKDPVPHPLWRRE